MQLPTIDEAIKFAKDNNFRFEPGAVGNRKCGCAITLVAMMCGAEQIDDMYTYNWMRHYFNNHEAPIDMYVGFDLPNSQIHEYSSEFYNFGVKLRDAVTEHKLWTTSV